MDQTIIEYFHLTLCRLRVDYTPRVVLMGVNKKGLRVWDKQRNIYGDS